jgi:hypothetical protein
VTPAPTPVFPPGRYGRRREPAGPRRWLAIPVLAIVLLAAVWVAWTLYQRYGRPTFNPSPATVVEVTDATVTVRFTVHKSADEQGSCRVRVRDYSGVPVGYADAPVGAGRNLTVTVSLPTTGRAYAADVLGCATR